MSTAMKAMKRARSSVGASSTTGGATTGAATGDIDDVLVSSGSIAKAGDASMHGEFHVKLNQTNIGDNNNKFYVIQLLKLKSGEFATWNRWGRVGEEGAHKFSKFGKGDKGEADAKKDFEKKFKDKTVNDWGAIASGTEFKPKAKKYHIVETEAAGAGGEPSAKKQKLNNGGAKATDANAKLTNSGKLGKELNQVLKLIFDEDMFRDSMKELEVDVDKMPLGALTKAQIKKGNAVLEKIESELDKMANGGKKNNKVLEALSSEFYTTIPHNFGRKKPTVIDSKDLWNKKVELLNVLNDIEVAQGIGSASGSKGHDDVLYQKYAALNNAMKLVDPKSSEHKVISTSKITIKKSIFYL